MNTSDCVIEVIDEPGDDVFVVATCIVDGQSAMLSSCFCPENTEVGFRMAIDYLDKACGCHTRHRDVSAGLVARGWKVLLKRLRQADWRRRNAKQKREYRSFIARDRWLTRCLTTRRRDAFIKAWHRYYPENSAADEAYDLLSGC